MCAQGAGTLPKHGDLQRSRTTTTAEGPPVSAPSSLIPPRDSPPRSPAVTSRPFLEPSPISVTVLLRPSRQGALSSLSLGDSSFPSPPHLCPSRVPPSAAWGAPNCPSLPHRPKPRSAALCKSLSPTPQRVALHNPSVRGLPAFNRSEAPPPGHLTEPDAPPIEQRAQGECRVQAAAAAPARTAAAAGATAQGLRAIGSR